MREPVGGAGSTLSEAAAWLLAEATERGQGLDSRTLRVGWLCWVCGATHFTGRLARLNGNDRRMGARRRLARRTRPNGEGLCSGVLHAHVVV